MGNDIALPIPVTADQVVALQAEMMGMDQLTPPEPTHYFAEGLYGRSIVMPAGSAWVGKTHSRSHILVMIYGEMQVTLPDGFVHHMTGHNIIVSPAGRKSAFKVLQDTCLLTVHHTFNTDLDVIEDEIITPEVGLLPGNGGAA